MNDLPLSPTLDAFILSVAPIHYPTDSAPGESEGLFNWAEKNEVGFHPLPVWNGASDNSIYGSPEVNYAYRAWHDATHIKLGVGFDLESERQVALTHVRDAWEAGLSMDDCNLLWIDSQGQNEYFKANGDFVENQRAFALHAIEFGIDASLAIKL